MEDRAKLLRSPVKDVEIKKGMTVKELLEEFSHCGGFTAKKLWRAVEILREAMLDPECVIFLSFPAAIVATGTRGVIKDMVSRGFVDVIITTCGTLDHDLARAWAKYYEGDFMADDQFLRDLGIHRLGSVFVPEENYGKVLEEHLIPILEEIYHEGKRHLSTRDLIWEVGKRSPEGTILHEAYKRGVPIYVPGISDGSFGSQIWIFKEKHRDFIVDVFLDEHELSNIIFDAKKTGALIVGGGISKHHTIWWNQFREGLEYATYITTAPEWDGSLSGARMREAISWKKLKRSAQYVTVEGDATLILPLIHSYLVEEIGKRENKRVLEGYI